MPEQDQTPPPAPVHEVQSDLEKELLPAWLDRDPAADEPNYAGYVLSFLPVVLVVVLLGLAAVVAWQRLSEPSPVDQGNTPISAVEAPTR